MNPKNQNSSLRVLGCSGSEAPNDSTCSFVLGGRVLFDVGSAASLLNIEEQRAIDAVYLTHAHLDHIKDLAFIAENVFSSRKSPIQVFGHEQVLNAVHQQLFNEVIWPDFSKLPSVDNPILQFVPIEIGSKNKVFGLEAMEFEAVEVNHPGPTIGFILHGPSRSLAYVGDTGPTEEIWQRIGDDERVTDIFVEASFPNRFGELAALSRHLTPELLERELGKMRRSNLNIHVYHIKVPHRQEVEQELSKLQSTQVKILAPGTVFDLA